MVVPEIFGYFVKNPLNVSGLLDLVCSATGTLTQIIDEFSQVLGGPRFSFRNGIQGTPAFFARATAVLAFKALELSSPSVNRMRTFLPGRWESSCAASESGTDIGCYGSLLSQPREKRSAAQISCIRVGLS
jgi:hypothetical protein